MKKPSPALQGMTWVGLVAFVAFHIVAIYNTEWMLLEKGYYALTFLGGIIMSFVLSNMLRDNDEYRQWEMKQKGIQIKNED